MNQVLTCWSPMQRCPTQWAGRKIGLSILKYIKWQRTNKILLCDNSLFQQKDQQRRWIVYHCRLKADHRLLREPRLLIQAIVRFFGPSAISWPGGKTKKLRAQCKAFVLRKGDRPPLFCWRNSSISAPFVFLTLADCSSCRSWWKPGNR